MLADIVPMAVVAEELKALFTEVKQSMEVWFPDTENGWTPTRWDECGKGLLVLAEREDCFVAVAISFGC